jgi:hypothetical protein
LDFRPYLGFVLLISLLRSLRAPIGEEIFAQGEKELLLSSCYDKIFVIAMKEGNMKCTRERHFTTKLKLKVPEVSTFLRN